MATPAGAPTSDPYVTRGDQTSAGYTGHPGAFFTVRVYDKAFNYLGFISGYESLSATIRHNAISTCDLVIRTDHPRVAQLLQPGARLQLDYNGFLMSGRVETREAAAGAGQPTMSFHMVDDFQYLSTILAWPNPGGSISNQGATGRHWKLRGPASNVVEYTVLQNADRLGLNLAAYGSRADLGSTTSIRARMDTLADVLVAKADRNGIGIRIGGYGTDGNLALRFVVPVVRDHILTVESGAVTDWSWTQSEASVTRMVLGGAGEGTAREFHSFINTAREATLGTIKEIYVEARDIGGDLEQALSDAKDLAIDYEKKNQASLLFVPLTTAAYDKADVYQVLYDEAVWTRDHGPTDAEDSTVHTKNVARVQDYSSHLADALDVYNNYVDQSAAAEVELATAQAAVDANIALIVALRISTAVEYQERAAEVFAEGATKYGLSLTLAETDSFRYGVTFEVGDTVTMQIDPGVVITDVVREVTITDTVEAGLVVTPSVGDQDSLSSPNRLLVGTLKRLLSAVRKQQTVR